MNATYGSDWVDRAVRMWGARRPVPQVSFTDGQIVTLVESFSVSPLGSLLRVPANTTAVIADPDMGPVPYGPGDHVVHLPAGNYTLQYVDLRRHVTELPQIAARTRDGWEATLTLTVIWQVNQPKLIVGLDDPIQALITACVSASMEAIQRLDHDRLVRGSGESVQPYTNREIASTIRRQIHLGSDWQGIRIIDVMVVGRAGDVRRLEIEQKASVEKAEIEQQLGLVPQRRELEVKEAETVRLRHEEEERVRLRKAQIAATEAVLTRNAQIQQVEIQRLAEVQRLQHEQTLRSMEVRGQAFGQLAAALLQAQANPGLMRALDENGREALIGALRSLAQNIPPVMVGLPGPVDPLPLRERLAQELGGVLRLPGARCEAIEPQDADCFRISVHYLRLRIDILCGPEYPNEPPRRVLVTQKPGPVAQKVDLPWTPGMSLEDIVLVVASVSGGGWSGGTNPTPSPVDGDGGKGRTRPVK